MFTSRQEIMDHFDQLANQIDVLAEEALLDLSRKEPKNEQALENVNSIREQFLEKIKITKEFNLNNLNKESIFCFLVQDFVEKSSRKNGQFGNLVLINEILPKVVLTYVMYDTF